MVLPTQPATAMPDGAATPDRVRYYQPGTGNILNHFASLTTPDHSAQQPTAPVAANGGGNVQLRQRRTAMASSGMGRQEPAVPFEARLDGLGQSKKARSMEQENNQQLHDLTGDHVMEQVTTAAVAVAATANESGSNNKDARGMAGSFSREDKLQQWQQQKKEKPVPPRASSRVKSVPDAPSPNRVKGRDAREMAEDNNAKNTSGQIFTMNFSPPRHTHGRASRRSTTGDADPSSIASRLSTPERKLGSSNGSTASKGGRASAGSLVLPDASFTSDSYSLLASMQFISRDLFEEERANKSTSDKERAFLYKKRYMDVYGLAVGLSRRVSDLEMIRLQKMDEIMKLQDTIRKQAFAIDMMTSDKETMTDSEDDYSSEKKIASLCRELGSLARQLSERDTYIESLHTERDESVRTLNELKVSQHAAMSATNGEPPMAVPSPTKHTAREHELRAEIERLQRANAQALEQLAAQRGTIEQLELKVERADHDRIRIQTSMQQTEEQLESVHTQWLKEKSDLLETMDDTKRRFGGECEKLRKETLTLKKSVQQGTEREVAMKVQLDASLRSLDEAKACIANLETQLGDSRSQLAGIGAKDAQIATLRHDLTVSRRETEQKMLENQHLRHELETTKQTLEMVQRQTRERAQALESRIYQAEIVRRSLHNKVMELKGNIRVFCRVRPVLHHERDEQRDVEIFNFPDYVGERRQIELIAGPKSHVGYGQNGARDAVVKKYAFDFDLVFNGSCTQEDVFLEVSALVQSALDGFNVCIFAYGQTGSGKTYTMQGLTSSPDEDNNASSSHMGIVGRAIAHIYETIADLRSSGWEFSVSLEMIEIYNETLRDLLAPPGSLDKVDLRLDAEGKPTVTNSCVHVIEDERAAWKLLEKALTRRATKTTNMNDRSSRSHCVISFRLSGVNALNGDRRSSVVHLVDLAGSERLSKSGSGNDKEMLKEAQCINKSLSSLGNVICALAKKSGHVPFRDSKLTHFLSPSLGGDSKTLMICNLSPLRQHREETLNSLRFAKTVNSCEIAFPSFGSKA